MTPDLKLATAAALRRHLVRYAPPTDPRKNAREKARAELKKGARVTWAGLVALVPSASTPGKRYRVEPNSICSCEAGQHGCPCWHAAAVELQRERGQVPAAARSVLPANTRIRSPR